MGESEASVRFINPETMPRSRGYSQMAEVRGGRTVYISGQVPLDVDGQLVGEGDFAAQARQVFENLRLALEAAGMKFAQVVKLGIFVTDIGDLPQVREIRDAYVNTEQPPTSTAVEVGALFRPDVLIEVEAIAVG
jgi:reactive intermediate/imine deaminase